MTGVRISGGETFPADLVIVSAGVRANTALAGSIGAETERGVVVNARMETNIPEYMRAGDCAQYQGMNYAIWPEASEQGRTAGANAAGEVLEYQSAAAALTFHGMNTALFAAGDNGRKIQSSLQDGGVPGYGKRDSITNIIFSTTDCAA